MLQDVIIERAEQDTLTVLAATPGVRDEEIALDIKAASGGVLTLTVRIADSRPVVTDGRLRHRLTLQILGSVWTSHQEPLVS